ncbi:MAG: hypothetical protein VR68_03985, partial [Peptococcaceae bacterium BRH_c4a]
MKRIIYVIALMLITTMLYSAASAGEIQKSLADGQGGDGEKTYLVGLKNQEKGLEKAKAKGKIKRKYKHLPLAAVKMTPGKAKELGKDSDILFVEPDGLVRAEEAFPWNASEISADLSLSRSFTGKGIKIAVLDTGIDQSHEDIKVAGGAAFIDEKAGLSPESAGDYTDDNGHGTHGAGIIAALANGKGTIGVASGSALYSAKVLDGAGAGTYSQVIAAVDWAIEHNMDIICMSLGGEQYSRALEQAMQKAYDSGILLVAAAGNGGEILYPAKYAPVIAVGAVDRNRQRASFSSTGPELEIMAPGVGIDSTLPGNKYGTMSGTSAAAPHIAGAAALIWSYRPELTNIQIRDLLKANALPLGSPAEYGYGLVDLSGVFGGRSEQKEIEPASYETRKIKEYLLTNQGLARSAAVASLSSADPAVREYAAKILGEIGEKGELPPLAASAQEDPRENVRAQATVSQAKIYLRSATDENKKLSLLQDLLNSDQSPARDYALYQLAAMSGDGARAVAKEALSSEADPVRKSVLEAVCTQSAGPDLTGLTYSGDTAESIVKLLAYGREGDGQTITAGESATVSLKLYSKHSRVEVRVYKNSNPGNIIASRTYYSVQADYPVSYTWKTSASTAPGAYTIWYHYPDNDIYDNDFDDYFTIYVEEAESEEPYDRYEPNNSRSSATGISIGNSYTAYIGRAYDIDYYRFTPSGSGMLNFVMDGPSGVDFDVELLSSSGSYLTGSAGSSADESFSCNVTGGATYYILIEGYGSHYSSSPYRFSANLEIIRDVYEPNNDRPSATPINLGSAYTAYIDYSGDEDYYRFIPSLTGDLTFNMTGPSGLDYDVQLKNSGGGTIAGSYGWQANESFTCQVSAGSTYYIRIYGCGDDSSGSPYRFSTTLKPNRATLSVTSITVPAKVNPGQVFSVEATVRNTSGITANNVRMEIIPQSGLTLDSGSLVKNLGNLGAGSQTNAEWQLAASVTSPCVKTVSVKAWADNADQNILQSGSINIVLAPITGKDATEKICRTFDGEITRVYGENYGLDPVNLANGAYVTAKKLLTVNGAQPVEFTAHYNSLLLHQGPMGRGWGHNFEARAQVGANGDIDIYWDNSRKNTFTNSSGIYTPADLANRFDTLVKKGDGSYTLTRQDQSVYIFNSNGKLAEQKNGHGQSLTMSYNGTGGLSSVSEPVSGQYLAFSYNAAGMIDSVFDRSGLRVSFAYDTAENLTGITDTNGKITTYTYNTDGQLLTVTKPDGIKTIINNYDDQGRVTAQDDADQSNQTARITYDENSQPGMVITTVTNWVGHSRVHTYNDKYQLLSVKDELGSTESYIYDLNGNRITATDAANRTSSFTYDARGNLLTATDPAGRITRMTYDSKNNLHSVENAAGKKVILEYDSNNNPVKITDPMGNTTNYSYNSNGLLQSTAVPGMGTTTYRYSSGLLESVTGPEGDTVNYGYNGAGRVTSLTDGAGNTTHMTYDNGGNLLSVTDPLGNTASYTYNSRGKMVTATDPMGYTTNYGYNSSGRVASITNALGSRTGYEYDGEGRLKRVIDARGNAITMNYDAKGRLISITNPVGNTTTYEYNAVDGLVGQKDAMSRQILSITYDAVNNPLTVTDALGRTVSSQYDILNRLTRITDPAGRITRFDYDDLNRLVTTTDALNGQARQSFDSAGKRTALTDPNSNQAAYSYDRAGRLTSSTSASGSTVSYGYDARSLLTQLTNGRGQKAEFRYDAAGRITSADYPEETVSYTYDGNGNLLTVKDNNGTITREYDVLNRVKKYTDSRGNVIQYGYDTVGNLTALTYPGGRQVRYEYDAANRLTRVTDWAGRATSYEYDANSRLVRTTRPNGTVLTADYNAAGQILQQKDVDGSGRTIVQYDYTYDSAGNITTEQEAGNAAPHTMEGATMTYTSDNRLATYNGRQAECDSDGNMTKGPLGGAMGSYTYDSRNRLTSAGSTAYRYDAENNRTGVTVNGSQTGYVINPNILLSQVLISTGEKGNQTCYVYGLGLIGQEEQDGSYKTYHYDLRGSTVALTDQSGNITDRFIYGPYGELAEQEGKTATPFLFSGNYGVMT